jgi:hypothetical protein
MESLLRAVLEAVFTPSPLVGLLMFAVVVAVMVM